jgi:hypothetical protein
LAEVEQHGSERMGEDANVLRFDIAVDPTMGVQEPQASQGISEEGRRL